MLSIDLVDMKTFRYDVALFRQYGKIARQIKIQLVKYILGWTPKGELFLALWI